MTSSNISQDHTYISARDTLTAKFENNALYTGSGGNDFYVDKNASGQYQLNIGFGYNITANINSAENDLISAGIITASQWAAIESEAKNPTESSADNLISLLNTNISRGQAYSLMDIHYNSVETSIDNIAAQYPLLSSSLLSDPNIRMEFRRQFTFLPRYATLRHGSHRTIGCSRHPAPRNPAWQSAGDDFFLGCRLSALSGFAGRSGG